jgi:hypothetical protein
MLFTFKANTRSHPASSGKLFQNGSRWTARQPHQASTRTSRIVSILIVRRAPRHARVVDEDMNRFVLGLDSLDEAVAPSLGLDIRRGVRTVNAQYYGIRLTLRSATTYSQEPGPILFSFSETFIRSGTFSQVGENVIPDTSVGATRPTSLSCSSLRDAI